MQLKKLYFLPLAAVAILALIAIGCSKSNNNNSGTSGSVSATIGGTNFNPSLSTGWYSQDSSIFEIAGYNMASTDTTLLGLVIGTPITLNTPISANNSIITYIDTHSGNQFVAGYGFGHSSLTVTSLDSVNHKIAGNFTATLYNYTNLNDSVLVTNGKFSTSYAVEP